MNKHILILGAGFGGLEAATSLREELPADYTITLVDRNDHFLIGFSKFDVLFGRYGAEQVKAYYHDLAAEGVHFIRNEITRIDPVERRVYTTDHAFTYDYLIIALGADVAPELTPGFAEGGYEFYTLAGAERLHGVIRDFAGGDILLCILGQPYKCPPAPYEAAFQLRDFFLRRGISDRVGIKVLVPTPVALPVAPGADQEVKRRFAAREIELYTQHGVTAIDPARKVAVLPNGNMMAYDLFVGVPVHRPPAVVRESPLGNGSWIPVDPFTLQTGFTNVFAVGDVTHVPVGAQAVPKAGAFAETAARVVVSQIVYRETGRGEVQRYEAQGTCYLEFGDDEVAQISANFLGGNAPVVKLDQPSQQLREEKERFRNDRLERWFR
jgi:sulfide:quinone oxidoreductase